MPPTDEDASNTGECAGQSSEPAAVDANAKPMEKATPSKKEKGAKETGAQPKKQEVKEEWKDGLPNR